MDAAKGIILNVAVFVGTVLAPVGRAWCDVPTPAEWADVPVAVSTIDGSDASKVEPAMKEANGILGQAHIRLIVKMTKQRAPAGNNDAFLTESEGNGAQESGHRELDAAAGAGKGLMITFADNVWMERPASQLGPGTHSVLVKESNDAGPSGASYATGFFTYCPAGELAGDLDGDCDRAFLSVY